MPKKKARPEVFGDKYRRCMISSIAGYNLYKDTAIVILLKSGESVTLEFGNKYLVTKAIERLDGYFAVDTPETDPCNVCKNKNRPTAKPDEYDKTYCHRCFGNKRFCSPEGVGFLDEKEEE